MKIERDCLQTLICAKITAICQEELCHKKELKLQGSLSITIDEEEIVLISLDFMIFSPHNPQPSISKLPIYNDSVSSLSQLYCSDINNHSDNGISINSSWSGVLPEQQHHSDLFTSHSTSKLHTLTVDCVIDNDHTSVVWDIPSVKSLKPFDSSCELCSDDYCAENVNNENTAFLPEIRINQPNISQCSIQTQKLSDSVKPELKFNCSSVLEADSLEAVREGKNAKLTGVTETLIIAHTSENSNDNDTACEELNVSSENECSIECNLCGKKFSLNCQQQHECHAASSTQQRECHATSSTQQHECHASLSKQQHECHAASSTQQHECHAVSSTQEQPFKCVTCSETFHNLLALCTHQQSHSKKKCKKSTNLEDEACSMFVHNQVQLRGHPRKLCNMNILKIEASKQSQKGTVLEDKTDTTCLHKKAHSRSHPRKLCHKMFTYTSTLQTRHQLNGTLGLAKTRKDLSETESKLSCEICAKKFSYYGALLFHLRCHTDEHPFACSFCDKTFRYVNSLYVHHRKKHAGEKSHTCGECGHAFPWPHALFAHMNRKHAVQQRECQHCGKVFHTLRNLNNHVLSIHSKSKTKGNCGLIEYTNQLSVNVVETVTETEEELNINKSEENSIAIKSHVQSHYVSKCDDSRISSDNTDQLPQSARDSLPTAVELLKAKNCDESTGNTSSCGNNISYLKACNDIELLSHKCDEPCEICPAKFRSPKELSHHRHCHEKNHSFMCSFCGKKFRYAKDVYNHHRKHHAGEKSYTCDKCGVAFPWHFALVSHTKFKHPVKHLITFACQLCDKVFQKKISLKDHLVSNHRKFNAEDNCLLLDNIVQSAPDRVTESNINNYIEPAIYEHTDLSTPCAVSQSKFPSLSGKDTASSALKLSCVDSLPCVDELLHLNLSETGKHSLCESNHEENRSLIDTSQMLDFVVFFLPSVLESSIVNNQNEASRIQNEATNENKAETSNERPCDRVTSYLQAPDKSVLRPEIFPCESTSEGSCNISNTSQLPHCNVQPLPVMPELSNTNNYDDIRTQQISSGYGVRTRSSSWKEILKDISSCENDISYYNLTNNVELPFRESELSSRESVNEEPCEICPVKFQSPAALAVHRRRHYLARNFACSFCDTKYTSASSLFQHHKRYHAAAGVKSYDCDKCRKAFPWHHALLAHFKQMHGTVKKQRKIFTCQCCGKVYRNSVTLKHHFWKIHCKSNSEYNFTLIKNTTLFACPLCDKNFRKKCSLKNHFLNIHCESKSENNSSLIKNSANQLLLTETVEPINNAVDQFTTCYSSNEARKMSTYKNKDNQSINKTGEELTSMFFNHSMHYAKKCDDNLTKHKCNVCGEIFATTSLLDYHHRRVCGKKFPSCAKVSNQCEFENNDNILTEHNNQSPDNVDLSVPQIIEHSNMYNPKDLENQYRSSLSARCNLAESNFQCVTAMESPSVTLNLLNVSSVMYAAESLHMDSSGTGKNSLCESNSEVSNSKERACESATSSLQASVHTVRSLTISNSECNYNLNSNNTSQLPLYIVHPLPELSNAKNYNDALMRKDSIDTTELSTHESDYEEPCEICTEKFRSPAALLLHRRLHAFEHNFVCPFCDIKFRSAHCIYSHHRKYHAEEQSYACDKCGIIFPWRHALVSHTKWKHALSSGKSRKYACQHCDKAYWKKIELEYHVLAAHSDSNAVNNCALIKKFACPCCHKVFRKNYSLKKHLLMNHCEFNAQNNSFVIKNASHQLPHDVRSLPAIVEPINSASNQVPINSVCPIPAIVMNTNNYDEENTDERSSENPTSPPVMSDAIVLLSPNGYQINSKISSETVYPNKMPVYENKNFQKNSNKNKTDEEPILMSEELELINQNAIITEYQGKKSNIVQLPMNLSNTVNLQTPFHCNSVHETNPLEVVQEGESSRQTATAKPWLITQFDDDVDDVKLACEMCI